MKGILERIEKFMEFGGIRKDIALLSISGVAVVCSLVRRRRKSLEAENNGREITCECVRDELRRRAARFYSARRRCRSSRSRRSM